MRMLLTSLAILVAVHADACENVEGLLEQAYPRATIRAGELMVSGQYEQRILPEEVACKAWPYKPELTLIAVPLIEAQPVDDGEDRGDVEVIVADTKTGKPLARRLEQGMAYGDAIRFGGVSMDTARYDIRAGERAFGVVTAQHGSSRVNPYSERALWLYNFTGGEITRVLDGLVVEKLSGENDGNCEGIAVETKRTVAIGQGGNEGYRDLDIEQTEMITTTTEAGNDCQSTEKPGDAPKRLLLRFSDGRYRSADVAADDGLFSFIEIADAP